MGLLVATAAGVAVVTSPATRNDSVGPSLSELCPGDELARLRCSLEHFRTLAGGGLQPAAALADLDQRIRAGDVYAVLQCHIFAHDIGEVATPLIGLKAALDADMYQCFDAYIHGVLWQDATTASAARPAMSAEAIISWCGANRLKGTRSWEFCVHTTGHSLYFANQRDVPGALHACDTLSTGWSDCVDGVVMAWQVSAVDAKVRATRDGLLWEGLPSGLGTPKSFEQLCTSLEPQYRHQCFRMRSRLHGTQTVTVSRVAAEFCALPTADDVRACYETLGIAKMGLVEICSSAPDAATLQACTENHLRMISDNAAGERRDISALCRALLEQEPCQAIAALVERDREGIMFSRQRFYQRHPELQR